MLEVVLSAHPEFRKLDFVRHDCYGEDCIGAVVDTRQQADSLRALLSADRFSREGYRCRPPLESLAFPVKR